MKELLDNPELYHWLDAAGEYALAKTESADAAQELRKEYGSDTLSFAADVLNGSVDAPGARQAIGDYLQRAGVIDASWNLRPDVPVKDQSSRLVDLDPASRTEFQGLIDNHKLDVQENGAFVLTGQSIRVIGSVFKREESTGKYDCQMSVFFQDGRRCRIDNLSCWATGAGGKILLPASITNRGDLLIRGLAQNVQYSLHAPKRPAVALGLRVDGKQATNRNRPLVWQQRLRQGQAAAAWQEGDPVQQINSTDPAFVAAVLTDNVKQETTIAFYFVDKERPSGHVCYWIVDKEGTVLFSREDLELIPDEDGRSWTCKDIIPEQLRIPEDASLIYELTE